MTVDYINYFYVQIGSEFEPGVIQRGNALVMSQAKWNDRGTYLCIGLSNDGSTLAQASIAISVERKPRFTYKIVDCQVFFYLSNYLKSLYYR